MTMYKNIAMNMCDFDDNLKLFIKGSSIDKRITVTNLNNYSILKYTFDEEKYRVTLVSMKHSMNPNFESTKIFSEIKRNEMYITSGDAYMINNEFHVDVYDKSDFFNMSVSGELVCEFDYEFYELFNDLRDLKKGLNLTAIEIQIRIKDES